MSTSQSITPAGQPGRLARMLSALHPHPLRQQARQEIAALHGGLIAFAERYALNETPGGMAALNAAASGTPPVGDRELAEELRAMVEQAREYLHQLESGKLPQEIPEFAEMVAALEGSTSSSAAGLSARAELAGLLRKLDQLDNHWLAEARRKRQLSRIRRVGRDANNDKIDDNVQQPRPTAAPETRVDHELSALSAKALMAQAARRRDELAERLERERLEYELDRDDRDRDEFEPMDASVAFWSRYGEEIALLLIALDYCPEGTQILGSNRAAELMNLPPDVPPFEILERLRGEFEGRYLPIDADYDVRIVRAMAAGIPVSEAVALSQENLLDNNGLPELDSASVNSSAPMTDSGVRVQAVRTQFGIPLGIQAQTPWQPADPAEIGQEIRLRPEVG